MLRRYECYMEVLDNNLTGHIDMKLCIVIRILELHADELEG